MSGAILKNAVLRNCDLGWAWLIGTDLREADLEEVNWDGARLVKTKVYNHRRFQFANTSRMTIKDIDVSEAGDGTKICQADGLPARSARGRLGRIFDRLISPFR